MLDISSTNIKNWFQSIEIIIFTQKNDDCFSYTCTYISKHYFYILMKNIFLYINENIQTCQISISNIL